MAIDKEVFKTELKSLSDWFNRPISDDAKARLYLILSSELTTDEFKQAIIWAWKNCNSFPSPVQMIDGVKGSLRDRAIVEWTSLDKSAIGKKALSSCESTDLTFQRKEFIENFMAFAKDAKPQELQIKPSQAIAPSKDDRPRLRKPNPLTWTAEQENWTYEQWEQYLHEQNQGNTQAIYVSY